MVQSYAFRGGTTGVLGSPQKRQNHLSNNGLEMCQDDLGDQRVFQLKKQQLPTEKPNAHRTATPTHFSLSIYLYFFFSVFLSFFFLSFFLSETSVYLTNNTFSHEQNNVKHAGWVVAPCFLIDQEGERLPCRMKEEKDPPCKIQLGTQTVVNKFLCIDSSLERIG